MAEKAVLLPRAGNAKREAIKTDSQTAFMGDYDITNDELCISQANPHTLILDYIVTYLSF